MNFEKRDDELEEVHSIKPTHYFASVIKARVSQKRLVLELKNAHYKTSFTFEKKRDTKAHDAALDVCVRVTSSGRVEKKCSEGHFHYETQSVEKEFAWMSLPAEHVEDLISWLKNGTWGESN